MVGSGRITFLFFFTKTMSKEGANFAFIDNQNLYQGIKELNWRLDWKKFRTYLLEKYKVSRAYLFLGYVEENQKMYKFLERAGFFLRFKKTSFDSNHKVKGNVDVFLTLQTIIEINDYNKALIVTSDGDFYPLVEYLIKQDKLLSVLSPDEHICSRLLKQSAYSKINYLSSLKEKIGQAGRK